MAAATNGLPTPKFRLFTLPNSPYARKVILTLKSLKLPFEISEEDESHFSASFEALGPIRKAPVLVDSSTEPPTVVPDSTLILEYLDDVVGNIWGGGAAKEKLRARILEEESDLLAEEATLLARDRLVLNTSAAASPLFLRGAEARENRIARILGQLDSEIADSAQADSGARGGLDANKPGVPEFAAVSALGHLSWKVGDEWRQAYPRLARFADEMQAHPDVRATNPKV
ncbi:hypothetical protein DFJ74DRAFT_703263 [Hyaloraphidium curvatum]|nr:hypothetical protein DFJ74DRAFT_703263 [Hyaloraphidium curvatum]